MLNKPTTERAISFMKKNPTFIGRVLDYDFYEHPFLGDEHPLIAITSDGRVKRSDFYDLPTAEEIRGDNYFLGD